MAPAVTKLPACIRCPTCGGELPLDGKLRVDVTGGFISVGTRLEKLYAREAEIAFVLAECYPESISTTRLCSRIFTGQELDEINAMRSIDVHICRLRKALRPLGYTIVGRPYHHRRLVRL